MSFRTELLPQASRYFKKCTSAQKKIIISKLEFLNENPFPSDAKRIHGTKKLTFRIRAGSIRILYQVDKKIQLILIVKIDNRNSVYDKLK